MSNVVDLSNQVAQSLKNRVRAVGERRESSTVAMKRLVDPLLRAVREIGDSLGEPEVGINLGFDRGGSDIRFVGEMRVPEIHSLAGSRRVAAYEVRVMTDLQGDPLLIVELPRYSTHTDLRHDVGSLRREVEWQAVYDEGTSISVNELIGTIRKAAAQYASAREREMPDACAP